MQLVLVQLITRDATNIHEADTIGRNLYNSLLTEGRNSYGPKRLYLLRLSVSSVGNVLLY